MKTTIDLPDDLVTEVKIVAAREHRRLREVVADLLRAGLLARAEGRGVGAGGPRRAEQVAEEWLAAWGELGERIEDRSVDPRSCVEILRDDRR
jgi:hypothetical protein